MKNEETTQQEENWEWIGITEEEFLRIGKEVYDAKKNFDTEADVLEWFESQDYTERTKLFFVFKIARFTSRPTNPLQQILEELIP